MRSNRGEIATGTLLLILAGGAVLGWWAMPKIFHGASRRAEQSGKASQAVEAATTRTDAAATATGASAAAGVVTIAKANALAPDSPSKDFISREAPVVLAKLPAPDPAELLAAERRRAAVMEGQLEIAEKYYVQATERAAALQRERDLAVAAREQALQERRAVDVRLKEAAAAELAASRTKLILFAVAGVLAFVWLWAELRGASLRKMATAIIPKIDAFYDNAEKGLKDKLDAEVFEPLSKAMDGAEKRLVKKLRAKT